MRKVFKHLSAGPARAVGAAILLFALAGPACGPPPSHGKALKTSVRQFNEHLRWLSWGAAAKLVAPQTRGDWLAARNANAAGLKITDVAVAGVMMEGAEEEKATVHLRIQWHRVPNMTVRSTLWAQRWRRDEAGWVLVDEAPVKALPAPAPVNPVPAWP